MTFERRDSAGGAADTTLASGIDAVTLTIPIVSATGWPSGGANGPFWVIADYDIAGKEKIPIASRTGTTLTAVSRGGDGTSASSHAAGAKIRHCHTRNDTDEANYAMFQTVGRITTKGDLTPGAAATTTARLPAGANNTVLIADSTQATGLRWTTLAAASLATDSVGAAQIAADSVGTSEIAPLAVTAAEIAADTITATQVAANAIGASELADNAVDTAAIVNLNVTAGKIANGAIANGAMIATGQALFYTQAANPGAVGAGAMWFNTTKRTLLTRNAANTAWEVVSNLGPWIPYTPTLVNFTVGASGFNYARYTRHGTTVIINGFAKLGAGGSVTGDIAVGLPTLAPAADLRATYTVDEFSSHGAARGSDVSANLAFGAVGVIEQGTTAFDNTRLAFLVTAGGVAWNATTPFTWTPADGDRFSYFMEYETANAEDVNFV